MNEINRDINKKIFLIGYDIINTVADLSLDRSFEMERIAHRIAELGLKVSPPHPHAAEPESDDGLQFQLYLEDVLRAIRERFDERTASFFKLPVNAYMIMARTPMNDLSPIESSLDMLDLPSGLVEEFFAIKSSLAHGGSDPLDPLPVHDWLVKILNHVMTGRHVSKGF